MNSTIFRLDFLTLIELGIMEVSALGVLLCGCNNQALKWVWYLSLIYTGYTSDYKACISYIKLETFRLIHGPFHRVKNWAMCKIVCRDSSIHTYHI